MKSLIAEQPILVAIMLGVLGLGLLFGWLQSGQRPAAILGLITLALIPVTWMVASRWVTDREKIRDAIRQTAAAVQRNDHEAAVAIIADDRYRTLALSELPRFDFKVARVTGERYIKVDDQAFPPIAEADLNVRVELSGQGLGRGAMKIPRRLILNFEKMGDDWKVVRYQHLPIIGGPDSFSNQGLP